MLGCSLHHKPTGPGRLGRWFLPYLVCKSLVILEQGSRGCHPFPILLICSTARIKRLIHHVQVHACVVVPVVSCLMILQLMHHPANRCEYMWCDAHRSRFGITCHPASRLLQPSTLRRWMGCCRQQRPPSSRQGIFLLVYCGYSSALS